MDDSIKTSLAASYNNAKSSRDEKDIVPWKMKEINRVLSSLPEDFNGYSLLDLGSGSGLYGDYFSKKSMDVTCIDLSSSMIELCEEKGLHAKVMDFYNLEFGKESFDVVWSLNTLLHVPKCSMEKILQGVHRILKSDGVFYLGLYGGDNFEGIWDMDFYEPKRFFSFYDNESLKAVVEKYFYIRDFGTVDVNNRRNKCFQSMIATKK